MPERQILIVTTERDAHADDMVRKLSKDGHEVIRLNSQDIPLDIAIRLELGDPFQGNITLFKNSRHIDTASIRSVWWRKPADWNLPPTLGEQERIFVTEEIRHGFSGLWATLECYWVSFPENIRQASWKIEQLRRAAKFGLEIPRTIVTNDIEEARHFYKMCNGNVVYKVLTDPFLAAGKVHEPPQTAQVVHTTVLTEKHLEHLENIRLTPIMLQEYIQKDFELRITVIGNEIFAVEIHSQENEKTKVDWRHFDVQIPFRKASLSPSLLQTCIEFVHSYNLNYSAIDMIYTPDGRYIFLENNPNGQFLFAENMVPELKMLDALAKCLIRGSN